MLLVLFLLIILLVSSSMSLKDTTTAVVSNNNNNDSSPTSSSSTLQIKFPKYLTKKRTYDHSDALFGIPYFGSSILKQLYYTDSYMCHDTQNKDEIEFYPNITSTTKAASYYYILMIDRGGGCSFVTKVRNAQNMGAVGVIIANTKSYSTCNNNNNNCDNTTMMADDGTGMDIRIPSFLMHNLQDIRTIKRELIYKQNYIQIQMSWSRFDNNNYKQQQHDVSTTTTSSIVRVVEYELWTTPSIKLDSLLDFKQAAIAFQKRARFIPRMYIYTGHEIGCNYNHQNEYCFHACSEGYRYCAISTTITTTTNKQQHHDDHDQPKITGFDIVQESLRRQCIWYIYGGDNDGDNGVEWWDYVQAFEEFCYSPTKFSNTKCIGYAMEVANVNFRSVANCEHTTDELYYDTPNRIMDELIIVRQQKEKQQNTDALTTNPTLYVNRIKMNSGFLSYDTVFRAICAGFTRGYEPRICPICANNCGSNIIERSCVKTTHSNIPKLVCHGQQHQQQHMMHHHTSVKVDFLELFFITILFVIPLLVIIRLVIIATTQRHNTNNKQFSRSIGPNFFMSTDTTNTTTTIGNNNNDNNNNIISDEEKESIFSTVIC